MGARTGQARKRGDLEATVTAVRAKRSRGVSVEDAHIIGFTRDLIRKRRRSNDEGAAQRFGDEQFIDLTGTISCSMARDGRERVRAKG